ncbi:MAG: hydrogenobyrinic acid a,c-diamide synthase (glutamine-hydrolyzing) [Gammaproteobacteria bacterium]|nr:hydrogenobyrinic acid a,c-diamide synthase (glutamine-hydrolyzing) [Gammaproteobacteria bacterium]
MGLSAHLSQSYNVQTFKKGPDYIDPLWLGAASGRPAYNLDFYTMGEKEILQCYSQNSQTSEIVLVEGNKGLYDGMELDGSNSNAALAQLLKLPVILVIDTQGMTRGVAPLLLGYQQFEKNIRIAGVILNKVGGTRHESKLRAAVEHYTDISIVGAVHRHADLHIDERHLGLVPSNEKQQAMAIINAIKNQVTAQVDFELLKTLTTDSGKPSVTTETTTLKQFSNLRIGIAKDAAFGFYYAQDLQRFREHGAELVFIDTFKQQTLPAIDGLFIGGGFPETHLAELENNQSLRSDIKDKIENGLPVYAECGGLMYLSNSIQWNNKQFKMVGAIDADTYMNSRPQGRGYVCLKQIDNAPWPASSAVDAEFYAHEFHYSRLENINPELKFRYQVLRGEGIQHKQDGVIYKNTVASYAHLKNSDQVNWIENFLMFCQSAKV